MTKRTLPTEGDFQRSVIGLARATGWRLVHFRPARLKDGTWRTPLEGDRGFPDLILARGGIVIFAELKRSKKQRLEPEQEAWRDALQGVQYQTMLDIAVRVRWFLWTTDTPWEEIVDALNGRP